MKRARSVTIAAAALALLASSPICWAKDSKGKARGYQQHNLVSNPKSGIPADQEDATLVNPWGVAFSPGGPFWINDNGSGLSALYNGDGTAAFGPLPAPAVTVPPPAGGSPPSAPTGIVFNSSFVFALKDKMPALFIFATEDGTISGWNLGDGFPSNTTPPLAELKVDNSSETCSNGATGAVYKGLAQGVNTKGIFLYATNFRCATIDVFDGTFKTATLKGNFQDSGIPSDFAPFGISNVRGNLVVTFAKQDDKKHDDVAGPGNGFVDIFDTNGILIQRFASHGKLNSPWGIAEAPFNFGTVSSDLLIGNFGDGRINAYQSSGHFDGSLRDTSNKTISIDGLWSLIFGNGSVSDPGTLFFTAGPNGEKDGLFGTLTPQH